MAKKRKQNAGTYRRTSSGRVQARVMHEGKRVSLGTYETKAEAEAAVRRAVREMTLGTFAQETKTESEDFQTYAQEWLASRSLADRTRQQYAAILARFVAGTDLGSTPLPEITPTLVRSWHTGVAPGKKTMRAHAYALVRTILATAVTEERIESNPARIPGGSRVRRSREIRPATADEVAAIAEAMPERLRIAVLLAAWGGLRYGEVAELRRKDIDGDTIRVSRAVTFLAGGERRVKAPKTVAGVRSVVLPPHVLPALEEHLRHVGQEPDSLLVWDEGGRQLASSSFYGFYWPARAAAGRPDLSFHHLRHTQAVLFAQAGATISDLQARLGHETAGASLLYLHHVAGRDRALAERMSELAT